jgi:hypothetical protein
MDFGKVAAAAAVVVVVVVVVVGVYLAFSHGGPAGHGHQFLGFVMQAFVQRIQGTTRAGDDLLFAFALSHPLQLDRNEIMNDTERENERDEMVH